MSMTIILLTTARDAGFVHTVAALGDGQGKPCYDLQIDITAEFRRRETRCGHRPRSDSKLIYCNER